LAHEECPPIMPPPSPEPRRETGITGKFREAGRKPCGSRPSV
jgi:hypothetical protein